MVRKKFKMIAVDFDGTLLNDKKQLTKKTIEILRKKREDGYYLIGATARTLNSVKYNVDISLFDYLLLNNGLNIYDVKSNKIIFTESLSYDFCIKIFEILEPAVYKIDFCGIYNYYFYSKLNESKNSDFEIKITKIEDIKNINIARINAFFDNVNYLQEAEKIISRNFQNLNCITMNNKLKNINHLVIMPSKTNKYNSISYLCNKLNLQLSQVIYFGDNLNDKEIIKNAGCGIAMKNASQIIKDSAKYITDYDNNEDGVALFLEKIDKLL